MMAGGTRPLGCVLLLCDRRHLHAGGRRGECPAWRSVSFTNSMRWRKSFAVNVWGPAATGSNP